MVLSRNFSRSLRAREEESDDEPYSDELEVSSPSILDTGEGGEIQSSEEDLDGELAENDDDESDATNGNEDFKEKLSKIPFGALVKAQAAVNAIENDPTNKKRKRGAEESEEYREKLKALRQRIKEFKGSKKKADSDSKSIKRDSGSSTDSRSRAQDQRKATTFPDPPDSDSGSGSDSNSNSDEGDAPQSRKSRKSRSSKHAPQTLSSKRAVPRTREVVPTNTRSAPRDPRFDPLAGPINEIKFAANYSFLTDYRRSELQELKKALKTTKSEDVKEKLSKEITARENRERARENKEREERVRQQAKREEREKVKQGKKPFYLKEKEIKKRALVQKWEGMKGREREKAVERKRKKVEGKEKRKLPRTRREG
ncbi:DUF947-domain-containing protein [Patellaria atrata CBS 101060]|uniref:rRNA biogenesis protein RRP36 n=1 Tax=Patellaria atrata CBS 101060 TaxID=1346257 RepID=A0A9P4SCZ9_9PEZI|nr:DUF947-domain-containing protein [Patellaria atrata CBS 101060]